jgi:hypothetical protein
VNTNSHKQEHKTVPWSRGHEGEADLTLSVSCCFFFFSVVVFFFRLDVWYVFKEEANVLLLTRLCAAASLTQDCVVAAVCLPFCFFNWSLGSVVTIVALRCT